MNKSLLIGAAAALMLFSAFMAMHHDNKPFPVTPDWVLEEELLGKWKEWKQTYYREYLTVEEESHRFKIFVDNVKWIEANQQPEFVLEINQFGDLSKEEFRATYLGLKPSTEKPENVKYIKGVQANNTVNWVNQGDTSPVYNQGQCGSCWSFSATEGIESAYSVFNNIKPTPQLSMEQLVQCSSSFGNMGCNGGLMDNAFKYVMQNPLNTFANYPYTSGNGVTGTCNTALAMAGTWKVSTYTNVPTKNIDQLKMAINQQPVSVAVDAANWSFYKSGNFWLCGQQLDHGVQAVGYVDGQYWLVRNSWGTSWGINGFIQLKWGNTCGIADQASYPSVP